MQRIDHHHYHHRIIMNQWSRARSIGAGRWRINHHHRSLNAQQQHHTGDKCSSDTTSTPVVLHHHEEKEKEKENIDTTSVKAIYIVSDSTGWTAERAVSAALGQFEHRFANQDCQVHTHLYSGVNEVERLIEIIKDAAKENGILLYTLAEPTMAAAANKASKEWGVPSTNILGPIIEAIAAHLSVSPLGAPGRKLSRTEEYFKRIEAIEFTIKQDDGASPQNLHKADIVIAGVSRSGKTPLSIYLAQNGYKVANVPIVMGIELPKALFEVDKDKVFGLTINPVILQTIRTTRAKNLGFNNEMMSNYSGMDIVRQELEFAGRIFAQNPAWPVIEVTGKAIEEIAAVLLRLYHDRKQKYSMPRISKRY